MVLAKALALVFTGTAGVLGSASPLIHIGVTKSNWKNKWYQNTNDLLEPILKNCISTDNNGKFWNLFLEIEGGANSTNLSSPKISFRVQEVTVGTGAKKTIKISQSEGGDSWKEWKLEKIDNPKPSLNFKYFYKDQWGAGERYGNTTCDTDTQKLEPLSHEKFGPGAPLSSNEIKLTLATGDQCKKYFSSVECVVNIEASGKLKWKDGKQPKIIYTPFK